MNETVEFTNLCMVRDGDRVLVIDRKKKDWPGITFPGGHVEAGGALLQFDIEYLYHMYRIGRSL